MKAKSGGFERVMVTGAAGFLGSHLTRRLVNDGLEVGIINLYDEELWRIEDIKGSVDIHKVDIVDANQVFEAFDQFEPDIVFHLAAITGAARSRKDTSAMIDVNIKGTWNLLEASGRKRTPRFVNTSSFFVYEMAAEGLSETSRLSPLNIYALTKLNAEMACALYSKDHGLDAVTLRLFTPYGPVDAERKMISHVIRSFLKGNAPKLTTGLQEWDFIYVEDVVNAYMSLLNLSAAPGSHDIFNIGSGRAASVREMVEAIRRACGASVEPEWGAIPHREDEVWYARADITKAKSVLRWQPLFPLEKGLEQTVKWHRKNM